MEPMTFANWLALVLGCTFGSVAGFFIGGRLLLMYLKKNPIKFDRGGGKK